jgi:hypothetical protein
MLISAPGFTRRPLGNPYPGRRKTRWEINAWNELKTYACRNKRQAFRIAGRCTGDVEVCMIARRGNRLIEKVWRNYE